MPTLKCPVNDSYSVESGNKKLTYSIGLLSIDEVNLAGEAIRTINNNYYLNTGMAYWILSPYSFYENRLAAVMVVNAEGKGNFTIVHMNYGVRPVITIALSAPLLSGDGSQNDPYVI